MDTTLKSAIDKCFAISSKYEGTNYTGLTGSFDGMGFTYGIWGFNFGQGTLQTLLLQMYNLDKSLFIKCCDTVVNGKPENVANSLLVPARMKPKQAVAWSLARQNKSFKPLPHWIDVFENLGKELKFQELQRQWGMTRIKKAASYCEKYGVKTERGLALFFDTCVQQGGLKLTTQTKLTLRGISKQNYINKLKLIAETVSEQANPRWKADVAARRMTIVIGQGTVHGTRYDFEKSLGLSDTPLTFKF